MTSAYAAPSLDSGAYKVREPALVVIFSIITLGIYYLLLDLPGVPRVEGAHAARGSARSSAWSSGSSSGS